MSDYTYIRENSQLVEYQRRLKERNIREIAVDLEGEYNLHVYGERFCLLQIYDGREEVVVDPFTTSIDLIKALLENRDTLKIMYDCASDRSLLFKSHGILLNSILDLRPATELLEFEKQDLSSVVSAALGVGKSGSKKRFQQHNWTRRPIEPDAINYALQDVRHLFGLKDALLGKLVEAGRLGEFILENLKRQDRDPVVDREPGIFRSGRHKHLSRDQQKAFRRIYDVRERYARELDLPPNTVLANTDLFDLVTGRISIGEVSGNRRVPATTLDALRTDITAAESG